MPQKMSIARRSSRAATAAAAASWLFLGFWTSALVCLPPPKDGGAGAVAGVGAFAFVPRSPRATTTARRGSGATAVAAVRGRLPIPPPPPPPVNHDVPVDPMSLFRGLVDAISSWLDRIDLAELKSKLSDILPAFSGAQDASSSSSSSFSASWVGDLAQQVQELDSRILSQLSDAANGILLDSGDVLGDPNSAVATMMQPLVDRIRTGVLEPLLADGAAIPQWIQLHPTISLVGSSLLSYAVVSSLLSGDSEPPPSVPYPTGRYDPDAARAYFDSRLPLAIFRATEIVVRSASFGARVLKDYLDNKLEANEHQRGRELAELLTRLGPTFIKVGQSLSIRTDLLSVGYQRGLATLQDKVPAFSTAQATEIIERAWGRRVEDVLAGPLSSEPVAAASLGQVYRCALKDSEQVVAIKVQRPSIETQIALDMHLLREFAPVLKRVLSLNTDTVGTVDAWGRGFVDELDYLQEGENAGVFTEGIAGTPLKDVAFAPRVLPEWTTRDVLVTEWIDGERLDKSSSKDVTVLCSIAMNTYLTMLLELGLLHCDPHPGNLLRTTDGRLCILDWGMVTRLDKDLQLTLIEHVAHLTSGDYAEIPRDLLRLDFIPASKADQIDDSGVVELLTDIYSSWTKGGGAAAINVNDVINRLQDLTAEKGNLFQIPPYFAYIAKSFSVLEGIGLSNDPKYSIINECLPYISKRLLTDKEKMGPALATFVFGPEKSDIAHRIVDYKRVEQLVEGFGNYTTSSSGALLGMGSVSRTQLLEGAADQVLDLVFTEDETPLQKIVLEQLAKIVASSSRSVFTEIRERSGVLPSGRTVLGTALDPLGLWRTSPLVRVNELDRRTVETTRKLISLLERQITAENSDSRLDLTTLSRQEILELSSIMVRKVWERRRGVLRTGGRFARQILQLTADKLERGERDTRQLPERPKIENAKREDATPRLSTDRERVEQSRRRIVGSGPEPLLASRTFESSRLRAARRRLEDLQLDNVPDAVRVSDDNSP